MAGYRVTITRVGNGVIVDDTPSPHVFAPADKTLVFDSCEPFIDWAREFFAQTYPKPEQDAR